MEYVVNDEKVQTGESILTSGDDKIFPKGLLIGTVADAAPGTPFQVIRIKPATRLDRLEDVIVLLSQQELAPKKTDEISDVAIQPSPAPAPAETSPQRKPADPQPTAPAPQN